MELLLQLRLSSNPLPRKAKKKFSFTHYGDSQSLAKGRTLTPSVEYLNLKHRQNAS